MFPNKNSIDYAKTMHWVALSDGCVTYQTDMTFLVYTWEFVGLQNNVFEFDLQHVIRF